MLPIHVQQTGNQSWDIRSWNGVEQDATERVLTRSDIDLIALNAGVTLLHRDAEQRDITRVLLGTRFWATAHMNVDRLIEETLPFECVCQREGMTGRMGGGRAAARAPGACH
jgi:predicted SprT family Zn-dependent metalloprotease